MEECFDNAPNRLFDITLHFVVKRINNYLLFDADQNTYIFKDGIAFPGEVSERIFEEFQRQKTLKNDMVNCFFNQEITPLRNMNLKNGNISDANFAQLLSQKPHSLMVDHCEYFSDALSNIINAHGENLVNLKMITRTSQYKPIVTRDIDLYAPNLKKVVINHFQLSSFPMSNINIINQITYLDLSETLVMGSYLPDMPNLECLILYNTLRISDILNWVNRLHTLKHLDISRSDDGPGNFAKPNATLAKLVANLPLLEHLDLSGTNLAGTGAAAMVRVENSDDEEDDDADASSDGEDTYFIELCDVPGLASRVHRPLKFLGLYGTPYGACKRHHIPANVVSGDSSEEQIMVSAWTYMNRPTVLTRVLNDLYYLFRYDKIESIWNPLLVVLTAMESYFHENQIQIAGSASLFYVVKGREGSNLGLKLSERIILNVLRAMENHPSDGTILRNCCLTICQFNVPTEVLFVYDRLATILISSILMTTEVFMMRIGSYLLNSLACQVDKGHKVFLGKCGIIRCMLQIVTDRLENESCDDIMAMAWSTMWNVTDETPMNCQMFLDDVGLTTFQRCLLRFPDKPELLRNMMGLLGNVAEVKHLRPRLMDSRLIVLFDQLLDSDDDGIEVSYNAAGVLSHLASDGKEAWTLTEPSRADVLAHLVYAIDRWSLRSERNINYRSFGPILGLLRTFHTPECQHWAVWALANLTTMYPDKYCGLIETEGGLEFLYELLCSEQNKTIRTLTKLVLQNCIGYFSRSCITTDPLQFNN